MVSLERRGKDIIDESPVVCQHVENNGECTLLSHDAVHLTRGRPEQESLCRTIAHELQIAKCPLSSLAGIHCVAKPAALDYVWRSVAVPVIAYREVGGQGTA